jgi:hypothetical protein
MFCSVKFVRLFRDGCEEEGKIGWFNCTPPAPPPHLHLLYIGYGSIFNTFPQYQDKGTVIFQHFYFQLRKTKKIGRRSARWSLVEMLSQLLTEASRSSASSICFPLTTRDATSDSLNMHLCFTRSSVSSQDLQSGQARYWQAFFSFPGLTAFATSRVPFFSCNTWMLCA